MELYLSQRMTIKVHIYIYSQMGKQILSNAKSQISINCYAAEDEMKAHRHRAYSCSVLSRNGAVLPSYLPEGSGGKLSIVLLSVYK